MNFKNFQKIFNYIPSRKSGKKDPFVIKEDEIKSEVVELVNEFINFAYDCLNKKKFKEAYRYYLQIRSLYIEVPKKLKSKVYKDSLDIHDILVKNKFFDKK